MPFFASGEAKDRLLVLWFLHSFDLELTKTQLSTLFVSNDILSWFDLQSAAAELESLGLIAAVPRPFGQGYCITPEGENTLEMFYESIPASLREKISRMAEENREAIRRETQYDSRMEKRPGGGIDLKLRAMEWDGDLVSLSLLLPDPETAKTAAAKWPEKAERIYQLLLQELLD